MKDNNIRYKIKVNEFEFEFSEEQVDAFDIVKKCAVEFNLLKDHRSVNAKLLQADSTAKNSTIEIEGEIYTVTIKDELDQVLENMGFGLATSKLVKDIKAPMPGLVLEIAVAKGQQVNEGDKILILGAMKMENSIVVSVNATIKRIAVAAGDAVEKGQVLVELE
jgi:biotin carboxyl carrier protein